MKKIYLSMLIIIILVFTSCSVSTTKTYKFSLKNGKEFVIECDNNSDYVFKSKAEGTIQALNDGKETVEIIPIDSGDAKAYFQGGDLKNEPGVIDVGSVKTHDYLIIESIENGYMCVYDASNSFGVILRTYEPVDNIYDILNNVDFY